VPSTPRDDQEERLAATRSALQAATLFGHPEISWSVVLGASLGETVPVQLVAERVRVAFEPRPDLGLVPDVVGFDLPSGEVGDAFDIAGNRPYSPVEPLVRVLVIDDPPHLAVAAHHAVLDGLGLVSLLSVALGAEQHTDARGLPPERPARRGFVASGLTRLGEAMIRPPAKVAPEGGRPSSGGDWLLTRPLARRPPGAAALSAAVVRTIAEWNAARSERSDRIVLAFGASLRPGSEPGLEDRSVFLRLAVGADEDQAALAEAIRAAPHERPDPPALVRRMSPVLRPLVRLVAPRLGSTAFLSSLGRVSGASIVRAIQFFPVAHGLSGVSVGMGGVEETSVLTVRCPRRRFSEDGSAALAAAIADHLHTI
jgi:hypothetical protein